MYPNAGYSKHTGKKSAFLPCGKCEFFYYYAAFLTVSFFKWNL